MLAIGSMVSVYDEEAVRAAMLACEAESAGPKKTYQKMLSLGGERFVTRPAGKETLESLGQQCPNFKGVLTDLGRYLELAMRGNGRLNILPVLLAGDPGVGKTHFAKCLAQSLGVPYSFLSMGTMSANWQLSGSAQTWSGARHGKVAEVLISETFANPVFLLDELDKTGGDSRYDPFGALLQLFESETASHFKDEYLEVDFDASAVLWVATANDIERIPDYILSRMVVYEVPVPNAEESAQIAENLYCMLLAKHGLPFDESLTDNVRDALSGIAPRQMKKVLLDALATAVEANRTHITVSDLSSFGYRVSRRIGF